MIDVQGVHHGFGRFCGAVLGGMLIKTHGELQSIDSSVGNSNSEILFNDSLKLQGQNSSSESMDVSAGSSWSSSLPSTSFPSRRASSPPTSVKRSTREM